MDEMVVLIGAVFAASLLGSLHCAGMCGAFMLFAIGAGTGPSKAEQARLHAAYHAGRLATYSLLGVIAGYAGAALDFGGSMVGVQRAAAALAGALMVGFGIVLIARLMGVKKRIDLVPSRFRRLIESLQRRAFKLPPFARALTIGLLTTLLPCGWLYAFAFTAAGTGSPLLGGVTMAVFWAGTLPVLVSLGVGAQAIAGPLRKHLPLATSLALVIVGCVMIAGRLNAPVMDRQTLQLTGDVPQAGEVACPLCHPEDG